MAKAKAKQNVVIPLLVAAIAEVMPIPGALAAAIVFPEEFTTSTRFIALTFILNFVIFFFLTRLIMRLYRSTKI